MNTNLRTLTNAEIIWIWRRRVGLTQARAAARLGITAKALWKIEAGEVDCRLRSDIKRYGRCASRAERCAIARRRVQFLFGHKQLARRFGISHVTLIAWERSGDPRLAQAWKAEGFRV